MKKILTLVFSIILVFTCYFSNVYAGNTSAEGNLEIKKAMDELSSMLITNVNDELEKISVDDLMSKCNIEEREQLEKTFGGISDIVLYSTPPKSENDDSLPAATIIDNLARDLGYKYTISVCTFQPAPGTFYCADFARTEKQKKVAMEPFGVVMGHTFLVLGDHIGEKPNMISVGLVPLESGLSLFDSINFFNCSVSFRHVPGGLYNDVNSLFTYRKTYPVSEEQVMNALHLLQDKEKALANKSAKYNLRDYNCATLADEILDNVGIVNKIEDHQWSFPDSMKIKIYNPYTGTDIDLREWVNNLEKNSGKYPNAVAEQLRSPEDQGNGNLASKTSLN